MEHPTAADLCAGAGGFSVGAQACGFNVRAAFELDPAAAATYRANIAEGDDMVVFRKDVTTFDPARLGDINALFVGPPCQPFSDAQGEPFDGDPEETVIYSICQYVEELEPAVLAIENVGGLKRNHRGVVVRVLEELRNLGYAVSLVSLQAEDYGVPQRRERAFILGVHGDLEPPARWEPPQDRAASAGQTTFAALDEGLKAYETAGEALSGLPDPLRSQPPSDDPVHRTPRNAPNRVDPRTIPTWVVKDGDHYVLGNGGLDGDLVMPPNHVAPDHAAETQRKYADWERGYCGRRTTDRRLHPEEPAPTMTVSNGTPPVHYQGRAPEVDASVSKVRRLTPREVFTLQTFPPQFCVGETRTEQYRQGGNAVPPLLANHVADHLLRTVADELGFAHLYGARDQEAPTTLEDEPMLLDDIEQSSR